MAKGKKALSRTYTVKMTGAAETPAGAPGGTAKAVVTLSTKLGKVCWTFTSLSGVSTPLAAHIHVGAARTAGNIVVPLSTGATFLTKGCVPASATLIRAIAANPHSYYVNIHNKQYPGPSNQPPAQRIRFGGTGTSLSAAPDRGSLRSSDRRNERLCFPYGPLLFVEAEVQIRAPVAKMWLTVPLLSRFTRT